MGRPRPLPRKQDTKHPVRERKASRKQLDEGNDINDKSGQYNANDRTPWDYGPSGDDRTL